MHCVSEQTASSVSALCLTSIAIYALLMLSFCIWQPHSRWRATIEICTCTSKLCCVYKFLHANKCCHYYLLSIACEQQVCPMSLISPWMGRPLVWTSICDHMLVITSTSLISGSTPDPVDTSEGRKKLSKLSDWFTWCQTCKHGGHADHMTEWFRSHSECPVTGCTCKCNTLDTITNVDGDSVKSVVPVTWH